MTRTGSYNLRRDTLRMHHLDLILPITVIVIAEFLLFLGNMKAAIAVHAMNIMMLVFLEMLFTDRTYPAIMLLSLFRILNVTMPVFFKLTLYSYATIYLPMFLPIYMIMRDGTFDRQAAGITLRGFWAYLPLAISVGFALGFGEYCVLKPEILVPEVNLKSILILSAVMILLVGLMEEFIFRSLLQNIIMERIGSTPGLLASSMVFGLMHSGYHLPMELVYVFFAGIVFGVMFWSTKSLPIIAITHGVTNISLFLVVPAFPYYLPYFIGIPLLIHVILGGVIRKIRTCESSPP